MEIIVIIKGLLLLLLIYLAGGELYGWGHNGLLNLRILIQSV